MKKKTTTPNPAPPNPVAPELADMELADTELADTNTLAAEATDGEPNEALQRYRRQFAQIQAQRDALGVRDRTLGTVRAILFLLALLFWLIGYGGDFVGARPLGWVAFVAFLVAVVLNEPVRDQLELLLRQRAVLRRLIARLNRDWNRLASDSLTRQLAEVPLPESQRDVASDLDLLGKASLFHLVSMAATTPGIRTLAGWLAGPAVAEDAIERTRAIESLAPKREERLRFYVLSRQVAESSGDPDRFTNWAAGDCWLDRHRWLSIWANVSASFAIVCFVTLGAAAFGLGTALTVKVSLFGLILLGCSNVILTAAVLGPVHAIFSVAMSSRSAVADYAELFASAQWLPIDQPSTSKTQLGEIRRTLLSDDRSAASAMRSLGKVAAAGSLRQSAATFLVYLPLQAFALWDVRVLQRLERWQRQYGDVAPHWFQALGQFEALVSLAAVRDEHPDWVYPQWVDPQLVDPQCSHGDQGQGSVLRAEQIGHPLLPDAVRVTNDVTVGPPGTLLLVTGSNMSGKSTMLRSIGLNVALAATGAPVCAKSFSLPSMELSTSIRVSDNLSEGVSFYMAELHRLKQVVDHARRLASHPDRLLLFLLDEILQGTNSRERQIAVVQVLRHLVKLNAIGAISTHDLELADEPELSAIAHTVHFRETIERDESGDDTMTFDYRMRDGVSPTTNALRLLEMVGLGDG